MKFLDRFSELKRLDELMATGKGGMAIIYGRRRVGKTRLLLEWVRKYHGLYSVADQSASGVQRRYFAEVIAGKFDGFSEVEYRDWRTLLDRFAREAKTKNWRGPIVIKELKFKTVKGCNMGKILSKYIFTGLVVLIFLTGCGEDKKEVKDYIQVVNPLLDYICDVSRNF